MSLLSLAALLMLMIVLAGCGGSNDPGGSNKPSEPASEPAPSDSQSNTNTDSGPKIAGELEIQYCVGGYGDAWQKSTIAQFKEKYPDVTIKESAGPKINDQMKPRWIQGDPPDLVFIDCAGGLDVPTAIKDGQLMDITEWFKTAENVDGELISSLLITQPQVFDGKSYTIPNVFGSWGTFYDAALFKKNNWAVPTDFDSFLAVSEQIKAAGITPYIHTGVYTGYFMGGFFFPAAVSANGDDPSVLQDIADMKEGVFKSEPVMKALQQVVTMRDKGFIDKASIALNHTDSQIQFVQHKDAFIPNGLWVENEMKKDTPEGFEFAMIPSIGQAPGGKYIANPYSTVLAVASKAKNPEAAKAFIQFMYTKKAAIEWAELTGSLMNFKVDLAGTKASPLSISASKYYSDPNLVVLPNFTNNADLNKEMENAMIALTDNKLTPEEWADRVEKAAAKLRAKN
ncbi:carbohydrate ABC transporter, N-acetylglucosamine/diacetylchitobiose-binding protein [Paenibacillus nasutitermitis]|uniref:Carbohydrate ABC transporter, N-acetylglucosamine/diacetylchitobiose-binding protein n=1 Tax=Paenibacillus nasutitermitis TaxID=1652958 RepID=A0A916YN63_9BACL|nr:carbohydrate ABC transporter, N-acetylglucosamine/diacetylchitobiose-binding protein [Paenibacillus nasutitermitis]